MITHANIDFHPFPEPFYLDLIIVSFGMIGPFVTTIIYVKLKEGYLHQEKRAFASVVDDEVAFPFSIVF